MSDTRLDEIVRDVLHEHADTQVLSPYPPTAVIRRTRRRLLRNGIVGVVALILLAVAAARAVPWDARSVPANRPSMRKGDGLIAFRVGPALYLIEPDGTGLRRVPTRCRQNACGAGNLAWSPDGGELVFGYSDARFVRVKDRYSLFLVGQDGADVRRLTSCHYPPCGEDDLPTWSPDGSKVAFIRSGGGRLEVVDRDGSNLTTLSTRVWGYPAWSPDGSRIADTVTDGDVATAPARIVVTRTDGTGSSTLVRGSAERSPADPAWSPDGREIAYRAGAPSEGASQIWVIGADGANPRLIYDNPRIEGGPSWSPDGTRLAVVANGSLLVMDADGSGRSVLAGTGVDSTPAKWNAVWSPSGTMLACWLGDRLVVVNANGAGERTLTNASHGERGEIAWQPLGS